MIRPLAGSDHEEWLPLWAGYLRFYEAELADEVTELTFTRLVRGEEGMFGFGAELEGALAGFAHCVAHPSTWSARGYCYLEDLYVDPSARGRGVGAVLVKAVYDAADERGLDRVYWHTRDSNAVARALYERVGENSGFLVYQRKSG